MASKWLRAVLLLAALALTRGQEGSEEPAQSEGEAYDDGAFEHDSQFQSDEDVAPKIPSHPDLGISYAFPDFARPTFPMGENVDALVGFVNRGSETFNVTTVFGTLNSPYDFSYIVQNFTAVSPGFLLKPAEQRSMLYKFTPDGRLEALDFTLCLRAAYTDSAGNEYLSVLFNGTMTLVESAAETSSKIVFQLTILGAILAVAGFYGYGHYAKYQAKQRKKQERAAAEAAAAAARSADQPLKDEWLSGLPGFSSKKEKKPASAGAKTRSKKVA